MFLYSWSTFFHIHAQIFKPYLLLNCCHFSSFLKLTKQNLNSTVSWGVIVYNLGYSKDLGSSKLCTRKLHIAAIQFQIRRSCRRMVFFAIIYESLCFKFYCYQYSILKCLIWFFSWTGLMSGKLGKPWFCSCNLTQHKRAETFCCQRGQVWVFWLYTQQLPRFDSRIRLMRRGLRKNCHHIFHLFLPLGHYKMRVTSIVVHSVSK